MIPEVEEMDERYGCSNIGEGEKVQIEFVSANPTGLLHMGNARGAALGDTLANIMAAAGFDVTREFYINDAGNQIETFGRSLEGPLPAAAGLRCALPRGRLSWRGPDRIDEGLYLTGGG